MRYHLVENKRTYTDTPYNNSGYLTINFDIVDENGQVVDTYVSNMIGYFYDIAPINEPWELTISLSEEEVWATAFLGASKKWQPLDCDIARYVGQDYSHMSARDCAELLWCKHVQRERQIIAQKRQQVAHEKNEFALWQAKMKKLQELKELEQKQAEEARLERIKQAEEDERIKRGSVATLLICIILIGIFYISSVFLISNLAYNLLFIIPYIKKIAIFLIGTILIMIFIILQ